MELRLTPQGTVRLVPRSSEESLSVPKIETAFDSDWREGLFTLAAEKLDSTNSPTALYWRKYASLYLTRLCHFPENSESFQVEEPSSAELAQMVLTAPPMQGGEYISAELLLKVWHNLDSWVGEAIAQSKGLTQFLRSRAPKWNQVGRVCVHLAENKNDEARPFAFMATFSTGFGMAGRLKHLPLRKALELYAGERNRPALIKLLSPIQNAGEKCAWLKTLIESGDIYRPMAWTVSRAYQLLRSVPELEESGLAVRLPDWWKKRPRPKVAVTIGNAKKAALGASAILDFNVEVALGDESLSAQELETLLSGSDGLVFFKGQWVEVDREKLREAIEHWKALRNQTKNGEISFIEGMRLLAGASADLRDEDRSEEEKQWVHVKAGKALREVIAGMRKPSQLAVTEPGKELQAALRPYQSEGLAWLQFLSELGLGACLADDMGLGKTIQVLALLLQIRRQTPNQKHTPSLLVVPASLLGNWRAEARKFTPSLKLVFLHPSESDQETLNAIATAPEKNLRDADLAVTTYAMATRQKWLATVNWRLVILDEAQAIKNPGTNQTRAVKKLPARSRIILTGTPVENRLGDLWSLFDFLNPGLLGSAKVFKSFVKKLEQRRHDQFSPLRKLVGPYILRRLKTDQRIISDLPEKTEMSRFCTLTRQQVKLYENIVTQMQKALQNVDGIARRGLVLQTLMRLKQVCNHPSQLTGDCEYKPEHSGKFLRLTEICTELAERQEKVLIFTQFREIIDPLEEYLTGIFGQSGLVLHGGTSVKKRKNLVDQFQDDDGPPFFLLSLKAGGTGLNLTAASHVIHFDRWWNPAVENQATDRAFRIGQKRNVLVHKFITQGTVEERIDTMIAEKRQLAEEILGGEGEINLTELSDDELIQLVRLDVNRAAI